MADRDQHPSREDEIRRAVFDQVDLQTAELEIVGSIYDGFAAAIVVTGQPRTVALTREYGDAVQLMALIERGRSALSAASEAGATAGGPVDTVWRCAMTVACNIAIDEQNRTNDDDGPSEVLNAQAGIIRRLKGVLEIDQNYRSEVEAILSHGSEPFITAPSSEADLVLRAQQPAALPTDEGGCVTKRFVIFTTPGWAPEKKGGWLKDEHLIDFLRSVMLHDNWKPGFRATVLELTWDNDLWASSATEYLSMHDEAIGRRRARKAWQEARAKHERIYKAAPKIKLGDEIDSYIKATAITRPTPDALQAMDREALIALIMKETTDDTVADGWDHIGKPNVLVQGCRYIRRNAPPSPEGYADPEAAAKRFAGFIADRLLAALQAEQGPK